MKRTAFILTGMAALTLAIYASNQLWAQTSSATSQAPSPKSRVGLLNLTYVIKHYKKFQTFQDEMKKTLDPFQTKDTSMKAEGEKLAKEMQTPATTQQRREEIDRKLKQLQRDIEDNKNDAQKLVVKKQEDQLKILYMDVRGVVEKYAQAHGFEMILHYSDAVTPDDYWSPANIARKMQIGALMPMYFANGVDVSFNIVTTLNGGNSAPPPTK